MKISMRLLCLLLAITFAITGCKDEEVESDERYNIFSVEDLGQAFKSTGLKDAQNDFNAIPISLLGTVTNIGEDGSFELSSDYVTIKVGITTGDYATVFNDLKDKDFVEGIGVRVDGVLSNIDINCENSEDKSELMSEYEAENTTVETTTEATTAETTTAETTTAETTVEITTMIATETVTENTSTVTETPTETTTSIDEYALSLGLDLEGIDETDAPLKYRIRSDNYDCTYTAELTNVTYVGLLTEEYTQPLYELEAYDIPVELTAGELILYAKEDVIARREAAIRQAEIEQEEAEKARLNKMSISELQTYIKGGCDGSSIAEPNVDAYNASPLTCFVIQNNSIMGLSDEGKKLKTLVVPDMTIPDNTLLWDDLKEANCVETLIFKGRHFVETRVKTPETEAERKKREYNKLPEPYTIEYSSDFNVKTAALKGCTSLKVLALPYGINTIGSSAFADCTNLEYVKMPVEVFTLEGHIFDGCDKIISLIMPETIRQNYSTEVLYNMAGLKNLIFTSNDAASAGIVDEDMYMFKGCDSLERVAISNTTQFDRSRLENAYKGLDKISFKFTQKAEVVENETKQN